MVGSAHPPITVAPVHLTISVPSAACLRKEKGGPGGVQGYCTFTATFFVGLFTVQ